MLKLAFLTTPPTLSQLVFELFSSCFLYLYVLSQLVSELFSSCFALEM
jgi:hypothetical protein